MEVMKLLGVYDSWAGNKWSSGIFLVYLQRGAVLDTRQKFKNSYTKAWPDEKVM